MRIIAGRFRSRRLKTLPGLQTRPTPDRLRESLFSILSPRIEGSTFLDIFAGTGVVGIEALSRGARHATFIESNAGALTVVRENLQVLGVEKEATVVRGKASLVLPEYQADLAFLDPPYEAASEYASVLTILADSPGCKLAIAQHDSRFQLEEVFGALHKARVLRQGNNSLTFFERQPT